MSAWALFGQSLSLIVGGAGLGLGLAFGGTLYFERNRAADLQADLLSETLLRYEVSAQLATCAARLTLASEGDDFDATIPSDLSDFIPPGGFLPPLQRPGD